MADVIKLPTAEQRRDKTAREYLETMQELGLAPIMIFSPTTSAERMRYIDSFAAGFIYCVARKGVTGA